MEQLSSAAFQAFAYWSGVLIIKFLLMAPLTAMQRFRKKVTKIITLV